jgi:hypothetical protein
MKSKLIVITTLLFALLACRCGQYKNGITREGVKIYRVASISGKNATTYVNEIIKTISDDQTSILLFEKGDYHFYPDSQYHKHYYESNTYQINPKKLGILIEKMRNITIDGQGSNFIFHGHIQPITVDNSQNIIVKNVNIDWEKPLTAEAKVLEADSVHLLLQIDTFQFPYQIHENKLTFHAEGWKADWKLSGGSWLIEIDQDHIIPAFTGDHGCVNGNLSQAKYTSMGTGLVKIAGKFTKWPTVGNYLIMRHSTRDHAGIFLYHSSGLKLENINVYHTSGLGILSQYCQDIDMEKVNMIPNPHKNRYLSGHDDGLHFMGCKGNININACHAQGLMDDPINIHGTYLPVHERSSDYVLKCRFAHDMSLGLNWAIKGDTIAFINKKNMLTKGFGVIQTCLLPDSNTVILTFKDKLPSWINKDYSIENLTWTPDVTITNCFVGSCRARGYLISTPGKVVIKHNTFETSGSAILIAGDANYWYESGAVKDVLIGDNEFRYPCNSSQYQFCHAVISIFPEIPEPDRNQPYHRNITIKNNSFNMADFPLLYAKSVDGLTFSGNKVTRSYAFKPWHYSRYTFRFDACKKVVIENNKISEDVLGKNISFINMVKGDISLRNQNLPMVEDSVRIE